MEFLNHKDTKTQTRINKLSVLVSLWLIWGVDLGDDAFTQQASGKELHTVIVHPLQQLLSALVYVTNTREVNQ